MSSLRVDDFDFRSASGVDRAAAPAERGQAACWSGSRHRRTCRMRKLLPIFPRLLAPATCSCSTTAASFPRASTPGAPLLRDREQPTGRIEVCSPSPPAKISGAPWSSPGKKVAIGERLVFPAPSGEILSKLKCSSAANSASACCASPRSTISSPCSTASATCPCRPTFAATMREDRERYQTVFSRERGSVAAPTAGLHFTPQVLDALAAKASRSPASPCTSASAPSRRSASSARRRPLHRERYTLSAATAEAINRAVARGRRIVAVGTTVVRTLEHCALGCSKQGRELEPHSGETEIFISPGFQFRLVGALLTNFHLPNRACSCWSAPSPAANKCSPPTATPSSRSTASSATAIACSSDVVRQYLGAATLNAQSSETSFEAVIPETL
jgi:S-adenosylmethionine:tRNA ribosyltransferase-isomerase